MNLKRLQADWDAFARRDPLWAILTAPEKKGGAWQIDEFFETGKAEIAGVMDYVQSLRPLARKRALDFGCGVGRLTQALAAYFEEVAGVDIAPAMLDLARQYNRHGDRCCYYFNPHPDLRLFAADSFDFVYSNITLQHIEPRYVRGYLREFVRILAPGGVMLFQLPGEPASRRDRLVERIVPAWALGRYRDWYFRRRFPGQPRMEMNGMRKEAVVRLLARSGARVLNATPGPALGRSQISFSYCATKMLEYVP